MFNFSRQHEHEYDREFKLEVKVPGYSSADTTVDVLGGNLVVVCKNDEYGEKRGKFRFSDVFDKASIKASVKNGILKITAQRSDTSTKIIVTD